MRISILIQKPSYLLYYVNWSRSHDNSKVKNKVVFLGLSYHECSGLVHVQRSEFKCNEWFESNSGIDKYLEMWQEGEE